MAGISCEAFALQNIPIIKKIIYFLQNLCEHKLVHY